MRNYSNYKDIFSISDYSRVRKHRQIINSVLSATTMGSLKMNDKLPSVNELAIDYNISRDTVVRAYAFLKENDIIDSIPGKGYYVKSAPREFEFKVFLLLNALSPQMKKFYDAFSMALKEIAVIDLYIYQNDLNDLKKQILYSNAKEYTHYVLLSDFEEGNDDFVDFIKAEIPLEKLIVLNDSFGKLESDLVRSCQDYSAEFLDALGSIKNQLKKYVGFRVINHIPNSINKSLQKFCEENELGIYLIEDFEKEELVENCVYVVFEDDESLVNLIKKIINKELIIGEHVGIISYGDDNPIKDLLAGGITVITPVYEKLGYQAADLILKKEQMRTKDSLKVTVRKSL